LTKDRIAGGFLLGKFNVAFECVSSG